MSTLSKPVASSQVSASFSPPYKPSWFDRLLDWVDGLPGPVGIYLTVLVFAQWLLINVLLWLNGKLPVGSFEVTLSYFAVIVSYVLGFWLYARGVASRALDTFRPLLQMDDAAYARLKYELLTLPAGQTGVLTIVFVVGSLLFLAWLSPSVYLDYTSSNLDAILQYGIVIVPSQVFAFLGIYRAFHQLRCVTRIQRLATSIDLYQAPPLYAFSSVTATISIGLLLPVYYVFASRPEMALGSPIVLSSLVAAVLVAVAMFLLPLREMHNRIGRERARMLVEVNRRFENLVMLVRQAVDAGEFRKMEEWNKALLNLVIERDTIEKFSSLPWERGTLTGFLTALILPIVLWIITRLLERLI